MTYKETIKYLREWESVVNVLCPLSRSYFEVSLQVNAANGSVFRRFSISNTFHSLPALTYYLSMLFAESQNLDNNL